MPRIASRLIASLLPADHEYTLWDDTVKGFGLRIWPSGRMTYIVKYRLRKQRTTKRHTLGTTAVLTAPQARAMAHDVLAAVRAGRDPAHEARQTRDTPTVADLAKRYLAEHAQPKKRPRSVVQDAGNLRRHILPALGEKPVHQVTRQDIARLHHQMRATPTTANRVLSLLSTMFALAEAWGLREQRSNPVHGIQRYRERKIERFLSADELRRLGEAMEEAEYLRSITPVSLACIRLLLFTGARAGEILGLQWSMIDCERGVARLPDSKTGAKTLRLPEPALAVLRSIPRTPGNPYVLVGRYGGPLGYPHYAWRRLCASAGIKNVRIHDIRHTYASQLVMSGVPLPLLQRLLGHSSPQMTNRYIAWADDPVQQAADAGGALIAKMLTPDDAIASRTQSGS